MSAAAKYSPQWFFLLGGVLLASWLFRTVLLRALHVRTPTSRPAYLYTSWGFSRCMFGLVLLASAIIYLFVDAELHSLVVDVAVALVWGAPLLLLMSCSVGEVLDVLDAVKLRFRGQDART